MKQTLAPLSVKNEKGFAVMESVVILFIFIILFSYTLGFFGVTHTAILQSISSRNYAFEILRHRSNLWYFRGNAVSEFRYHKYANRLHGTNSETAIQSGGVTQYPTERRVAMFKGDDEPDGRTSADHANAGAQVTPGQRNSSVSLDPVWIKIQYGICLTVDCGD